jgi:exopolysaccharide biosynthesis polyprenyl glycosylphosphotransferase
MFSKHKIILATIDALLILVGFQLGFWYVFRSGLDKAAGPYPVYHIPSITLAAVLFLMFFQLAGLYKYQAINNPIHQIQSILQAFVRILGTFIVLVFFIRSQHFADSRLTIGIAFTTSFMLIILARVIIIPKVYYYFVKAGRFRKRTLIIGAGEHGRMVCQYLKVTPKSYYNVIGFCDDDFSKCGTRVEGVKVLGTSYELESFIKKYSIQEIIIAISRVRKGEMFDIIDRCKNVGTVVHVVSDLYAEVNERMEAEKYGGLRTYRIAPFEVGIVRRFTWRLFNLIGSGLLLMILSPVFLAIAIAIKRDSDGPVFYMSDVVGIGGKPFKAFKFRSMYDASDKATKEKSKDLVEKGNNQHLAFMHDFIQGKSGGDYYVKIEDRITRVGRFIRKYSLDELPQIINVFRGEMGLVGPRFCTIAEYGFYKEWHKRRFQVKPGMTGLWQVSARSAVSYDDMVFLDLYYIENRNILFDIEILLQTIPVVLFGKGSRIEKAKEKSLEEKIEEFRNSGISEFRN